MHEARDPRGAGSAASGGELDFQRRYEELAPALHAWAELRIRPQMRALVEPGDVVQEVWCRAWRERAQVAALDPAFRGWLFRIAKNVLLEAFRRARAPAFRAGSAGTTTRVLALEGVPDSITAVSRRLARDEGLAKLVEWLRGLEEDERLLVAHVGLEGLSFAEVGERVGLSRDAVARRWQRLRARMAEQRLARDLLADPL
jgi:RNA polymerase sigma-70 factor (ECF subfamily)